MNTPKELTAGQTAALRKFTVKGRRTVYSNGKSIHYTALELGSAGSTLRSLASLGYMTVKINDSSLRGGERNAYGLTVKGIIAVNKIKRADKAAQ